MIQQPITSKVNPSSNRTHPNIGKVARSAVKGTVRRLTSLAQGAQSIFEKTITNPLDNTYAFSKKQLISFRQNLTSSIKSLWKKPDYNQMDAESLYLQLQTTLNDDLTKVHFAIKYDMIKRLSIGYVGSSVVMGLAGLTLAFGSVISFLEKVGDNAHYIYSLQSDSMSAAFTNFRKNPRNVLQLSQGVLYGTLSLLPLLVYKLMPKANSQKLSDNVKDSGTALKKTAQSLYEKAQTSFTKEYTEYFKQTEEILKALEKKMDSIEDKNIKALNKKIKVLHNEIEDLHNEIKTLNESLENVNNTSEITKLQSFSDKYKSFLANFYNPSLIHSYRKAFKDLNQDETSTKKQSKAYFFAQKSCNQILYILQSVAEYSIVLTALGMLGVGSSVISPLLLVISYYKTGTDITNFLISIATSL